MKKDLKTTLVEFDMQWEDAAANREYLDKLLEDCDSDLIVLPEMFTTGFSMNPAEVAEKANGTSAQWMKNLAKEKDCAITGSISTKEKGVFYNRLYFVTPEKTVVYDKKHLFGYGKETGVYSPGKEIVSAEYKGWKFRLTICYDLRFPAWCRNTDDYDVLLCPASWPKARDEQWRALLKARAIENMAYVIGVNRIGKDGYNLDYIGNSKVFDAVGHEVPLSQNHASLWNCELSESSLQGYRERYGFLNDRDEFQLSEN